MAPETTAAGSRVSGHTVFLKGEPKALGTVQIMIGIITFFMGINLSIVNLMFPLSPLTFSKITLWGSLFFISSGSLSVAAENHNRPNVVKASLWMNVLSAVVAGFEIILLCVDMIIWSHDSYYSHSCVASMWIKICGTLLLFTLLQFFVSIFTSVFACKATCCTTTPMYSQTLVHTQVMMTQPLMNQQQPMSQPPMNQQQPMNQPPMYQQQPMNQPPMYQQQPMNQPPMYQQQPMNQPPMYNPSYIQQVPEKPSVNSYKV